MAINECTIILKLIIVALGVTMKKGSRTFFFPLFFFWNNSIFYHIRKANPCREKRGSGVISFYFPSFFHFSASINNFFKRQISKSNHSEKQPLSTVKINSSQLLQSCNEEQKKILNSIIILQNSTIILKKKKSSNLW